MMISHAILSEFLALPLAYIDQHEQPNQFVLMILMILYSSLYFEALCSRAFRLCPSR